MPLISAPGAVIMVAEVPRRQPPLPGSSAPGFAIAASQNRRHYYDDSYGYYGGGPVYYGGGPVVYDPGPAYYGGYGGGHYGFQYGHGYRNTFPIP